MRLRFIAPALTLATLFGVCVSAGPASAHHGGPHVFTVTGNVDIHDDEPWPRGGVNCHQRLNATRNVGSNNRVTTWDWDNTCDGEIRVEFEWSGVLTTDGRLCNLSVAVFLYEGTTTSNQDLDGILRKTYTPCLPPNTLVRVTGGRVNNTEEGGDYANFSFDLQHTTP